MKLSTWKNQHFVLTIISPCSVGVWLYVPLTKQLNKILIVKRNWVQLMTINCLVTKRIEKVKLDKIPNPNRRLLQMILSNDTVNRLLPPFLPLAPQSRCKSPPTEPVRKTSSISSSEPRSRSSSILLDRLQIAPQPSWSSHCLCHPRPGCRVCSNTCWPPKSSRWQVSGCYCSNGPPFHTLDKTLFSKSN